MNFQGNKLSMVLALGLVLIVGFGAGYAVGGPDESEAATREDLQELQQEVSSLQENMVEVVKASGVSEAPDQPWPYVELDVEEVRKLAYAGHHDQNCAYGTFDAIISPLQEEIGHPYDQVPTFMLHFGGGGIVGEESVCGAVLGSIAAVTLITGEDYPGLIDEVMTYFQETPLPTDVSNEYAQSGEFTAEPLVSAPLTQTVSPSIDCGDSKEEWISVSGYDGGTDERKERCSRLSADMAAKTAEVLNAWAAGTTDVDPMVKYEEIFPGAEFDALEEDLYEVTRDGEVIGYAGLGSGEGYNDVIDVAVGISTDGTIQGVRVVDHSETVSIAGGITEEEFLSQFEELTVEDLDLTDDGGAIDAISGATVSCETVVEIVSEVVERLLEY